MGKNGGFWKERKKVKTDDGSSWLISKDPNGRRILDPTLNKQNIAAYYEDLYSRKDCEPHPYHSVVETEIQRMVNNREKGDEENDRIPTLMEISEAIQKKKNGKATTDWKNEILKRGGEEMVEFVFPVIKAFWREEKSPKQWNNGVITNVWKGKGDREIMANQRGITVSSAISTIAEEIVTNRVNKLAKVTQAQAGGQKGGSTVDHVFILRNIIALAKKQRRNLIVTYYDVVKAYDRADMDDMCYAMYKAGVCGKIWRLMKALNEELTAKINTKAGLTREITRITGGKQGGKLMVSLFAKMMDNLAEDMMANARLGIMVGHEKIPATLYMDDAVTYAEGYEQQRETLDCVNEFAVKHKLEWGPDKCKTMEIGGQKEKRDSWKLGQKIIKKCENYKYLGERINRNGKNDENVKERCDKLKSSARSIVTCCKTDVMRKIGMSVILKLYEAEAIPAFLYNSETWTLSKTEKKVLDRADIYAWKRMIGLPPTTPTAGILLTVGNLFASTRIELKQLLYLHKVLNKDEKHWTKSTLYALKELNIGWAKQAKELLGMWDLEQEWENIQKKPFLIWKREVMEAAEKRNIVRLREDCEVTTRGETRKRTKTKYVLETLDSPSYQRKTDVFISRQQYILHTRTLIMGRFGMLKCANNFSNGFKSKMCDKCGVLDNESHRINECPKWQNINLFASDEKINYADIYSHDIDMCLAVIDIILSIWDLENGKNEMRICN